MSLQLPDIEIIVQLINQTMFDRPLKALSFGHPDILASPIELEPLLGRVLQIRDNALVDRIGYWQEDWLGSAHQLFEALNIDLTAIDNRDVFGVEKIKLDLNYLIGFDSKYHIIIDPGTLEHVFNIGNPMTSIVKSLMVRGFVYHVSPMTMLNHGYWNMSPITYNDFYLANGFEVLFMRGRRKGGETFDVPLSRFKSYGNSILMFAARKIKEVDEIKWPLQSKYGF